MQYFYYIALFLIHFIYFILYILNAEEIDIKMNFKLILFYLYNLFVFVFTF